VNSVGNELVRVIVGPVNNGLAAETASVASGRSERA
jgi:hypothetical protein